MRQYTYMANFGFSAKPIPNLSIRKKATEVFNKKMARIASSGELASANKDVRGSALAKANKLKERMRAA